MIEEPFNVDPSGLKDPVIMTFKHTGLTKEDVGKVCYVSGDMTVALCSNGNKFDGEIVKIEKDCVAVKLDGVFNLPFSGTAPSGNDTLVSDADGKVKKDPAGKTYLILSVKNSNVYFIRA
ncbi:hypothetical protein FH581_017875 (plasmid) [Leptospira weilii]|uniref:hypothetical protein n=1 Tax=Leptospira weilii TaxID=28184 RepID=UPI001EF292C9|nr:hypothetical protein [Leptospira weilii]ULH29051.1 hypothetical protein FH586_03705 [Leptospira weilii]UPY79890.1 hypothetical protein FH581_016980 [Leptospira weilii]UPY80370.1 hypothetical protein FH581_024105 [Leptospira weilii]UPY80863.1 hypothetical protein FH581_017070 [Leptospira weilii]UPY81012.1 hypothetical protein FH581_017875 [Leptospira weilii]